MHFIKWLGLGTVFVCALGLGALLASFERERYRQAEAFLRFMRYVRLQIDCFSAPLSQILSLMDEELRLACGICEEGMRTGNWLAGTRLLLPPEGRALLAEFSAALGSGFREEQLRCCDYYMARFSPLCERLRAELPRRIRLAFLLPVALGGALILLLI